MNPTELAELRAWVGRTQSVEDVLRPFPAAALMATLDREGVRISTGDPLPPLAHWCYFLSLYPTREAGADGHARRGGFLPPVPLPRRMWAGSRLEFVHPLRIDERARRTSRIVEVKAKQGRSGDLVFVTVRHEIETDAGLALSDEHDILYRPAPAPGESAPKPAAAPTGAEWRREIRPDPVLLFRYSALTFNGHRIHYDRPYTTGVEGYPGLIVHGPLLATLLLDALAREHPGAVVRRFEFKALAPVFDTASFHACGRVEGDVAKLWIERGDGALSMDATATLG